MSTRPHAALCTLAACIALAHQQAPAQEAAGARGDRADAATLQKVEINGRRTPNADAVARRGRVGLLGDADVMDVPFGVTNYTVQTIQNQQAATIAEVVANDPSVRMSASPGGILDSLYVRGFPIGEGNLGEIAFDGVYGVAPNFRVLADYAERVELIKGPTALLNGMAPNSGVGGSVNIVPKRAGDRDLTQLAVDFSSRSQAGARIDMSRRFGARREFGLRVNTSLHDGDTALDKQSRNAKLGAVALDYRGAALMVSLDVIDQVERVDAPSRPYFVASSLTAVPAAPDGRLNVTQAWERSSIDDQSALLRAEYALNPALTLFANAGGARTGVDRVFGTPSITSAAGDVSTTPQHFQFDIRRQTVEAGLRTRFETGSLRHSVTLQATQYRDRLARGSVNGKAMPSNLNAPVEHAEQAIAAPASVPKISASDLTGVALADTIAMLGERVLLTLGVREQQVKSDNFNATTGAVSQRYDATATTPLVGLVVKPWAGTSVYANYIEGLSKGDVMPTTADGGGGESLPPYKARQGEIGLKLERDGLITTVALFQITKAGGRIVSGAFVPNEQRHRGIELGVVGQATESLRLLSGATWLDAEITQSASAGTVGNKPVGVPRVQANLGAEWDWAGVPGLTLTGAVYRTGRQQVNATNTLSIPAWTRVDVGVRYASTVLGKPTTLRLGVRNLLDRDYWSGVSSFGGLAQGAPRTLHLSATVDL